MFYLRFSFDTLRIGRSGDRIPVEARFAVPVRTGPEAHPASYILRTGSFPGVKRPVRSVDFPPPFTAEVKERVELYLWAFVVCYKVNFPSLPVFSVPVAMYP